MLCCFALRCLRKQFLLGLDDEVPACLPAIRLLHQWDVVLCCFHFTHNQSSLLNPSRIDSVQVVPRLPLCIHFPFPNWSSFQIIPITILPPKWRWNLEFNWILRASTLPPSKWIYPTTATTRPLLVQINSQLIIPIVCTSGGVKEGECKDWCNLHEFQLK